MNIHKRLDRSHQILLARLEQACLGPDASAHTAEQAALALAEHHSQRAGLYQSHARDHLCLANLLRQRGDMQKSAAHERSAAFARKLASRHEEWSAEHRGLARHHANTSEAAWDDIRKRASRVIFLKHFR